MATLTETAFYTRRTINWIILATIAYVLLRIALGLFLRAWLAVFPAKAPPPTHAFGKLPAVKFPVPIASPAAQLKYSLQTIEGSVPKASESAAVYFMPKTPANLLALTRTEDFAKRLEFDPTPIQESRNIYRFADPAAPLRRLRFDIVSNNFIIRYAFEQDTGIFSERNLPGADAAVAEAKNLLQTYDLYTDDLSNGESQVTFLKLTTDQLLPTTSLSNADAVRVDFYRRTVAGLPAVTGVWGEAPVSFIFSGSNNSKKRLIQFAYTWWPVDYQTSATYALKSSSQAWQELQSGGGYVVRYPQSGDTALVRQVSLAYYDSFDPQIYLQPVFVFEGDDGFLAYVSAVAAPWTEE